MDLPLDINMADTSRLFGCAVLDKYIADPAFFERFLSDAEFNRDEIVRTEPQPGYKTVATNELQTNALYYFSRQSKDMQKYYLDLLCEKIDECKIYEFFEIITKHWVDGKRNRSSSPKILRLKKAIYQYLKTSGRTTIFTRESEPLDSSIPIFDPFEIEHLLDVTQRVTEEFIFDYLEQRSDYPDNSISSIYVHRGLSLKTPLDEDIFFDQGILNSYSLCVTVPEKFAQQCPNAIPAIVSAAFPEFSGRILAFAPLIPNMNIDQMELVVIPSTKRMPIKFLGPFGGLYEYEIFEER